MTFLSAYDFLIGDDNPPRNWAESSPVDESWAMSHTHRCRRLSTVAYIPMTQLIYV